MKSLLHSIAALTGLAAGVALATFGQSVPVHPHLRIPMLFGGIALAATIPVRLYIRSKETVLLPAVMLTIPLALGVATGVSSYLLDLRGEQRTATVAEYIKSGPKESGPFVRLDGEEYPERFTVRREYAVGAPVEILVDPEGWALPEAVEIHYVGPWFPWVAGGGFLVTGAFYVVGVVRGRSKSPG